MKTFRDISHHPNLVPKSQSIALKVGGKSVCPNLQL